jgi:plastocyanin
MSITAAMVATLSVFGSSVAMAADRSIEMRDFAFSPQTVEIRVGDRVTWTNRDGVEHNATNGSFDTGLLAQGESASIRFLAAGTYAFFCAPHPSMTGTVIVRSVAAPATDTGAGLAASSEGGDALLGVVLGALALGTLVGLRLVARRAGSPSVAATDDAA